MSVCATASTRLLWAPSNLFLLVYSHTIGRDNLSGLDVLGCNLHDLYSRITYKGSMTYLIPFGIASFEPGACVNL